VLILLWLMAFLLVFSGCTEVVRLHLLCHVPLCLLMRVVLDAPRLLKLMDRYRLRRVEYTSYSWAFPRRTLVANIVESVTDP
jgi:hypothetical protein